MRKLWIPSVVMLSLGLLALPVGAQDNGGADEATPATAEMAPAAAIQPAPGAPAELSNLLSGDMFPLTMQLRQLNADWRRIRIGGQFEMGDMMQLYHQMFGSGTEEIFYTRGQTVQVGGQTYLVAYRLQSRGHAASLADMMRGGPNYKPPAPPAITAESTLALALLNLQTSGSLRDVQPFNLQQELATYNEAANAAAAPAAIAVPRVPAPAGAASPATPTTPTAATGAPASAAAGSPEARTAAINKASDENLKQLGMGLLMFLQDYNETLPNMETIADAQNALRPYVKSDAIFKNPGTNEAYVPNPRLSGKKLAHIVNPRATIAFYEARVSPNGTRSLLFLDGHIVRVKEAEWKKLKALYKIP